MTEAYMARGRPIYTLRLGTPERRVLEAAAALRSEPLSEFIRRASLDAAREIVGRTSPERAA
jgi:uncharacterized protein (DUF1778 family)